MSFATRGRGDLQNGRYTSDPGRARTSDLRFRNQDEPLPDDEGENGDEGVTDRSDNDLEPSGDVETDPPSGDERG